MKKQYLMAIDQGTTSSKVMLMDTELNSVGEHATPFEQHFPEPGHVEHDLSQVWQSVLSSIQKVVQKIDPKQILGIGITNQRETICFWDKKTMQPLCRAIVWQDRRTSKRCEELKSLKLETLIQEKTGLSVDPYFSASKVEWALKNNKAVSEAAQRGTLAIGTVDSYLLYRLTDGVTHATETSNASRTMLFDIEKKEWSQELLKLFQVGPEMLPEVKNSFGVLGETRKMKDLPDGIPISGMIGDQQSALLGQMCTQVGQAKCTYGTGAFLLMNTGKKLIKSKHRLLGTIAWTDQNGNTDYALEGSAFMAGATIQWLRDGLQIISKSGEIEALALQVETSEGVMFVPAFTGLGAPYWDPYAKATISGLTRGSNKAHLARAALEGIAFQNVDLLQAMEKDLGIKMKSLNVDGGACKNNLLMQIQADLLGCSLMRPVFTETTALGAIFAAGVGVGVWRDLSEVKNVWKLERVFEPLMKEELRKSRLQAWHAAVEWVKTRIEER